jgi:hypothetical protein
MYVKGDVGDVGDVKKSFGQIFLYKIIFRDFRKKIPQHPPHPPPIKKELM